MNKIKKYKPHNGCPKKKKRRKSRGMRLRRRRLKVRLFKKIKIRKFRRNRRSLKKKKLINILRFLIKKKNGGKRPKKISQPIHDFYYKGRNITFFLKLREFKKKFKSKKRNKMIIKETKKESLYYYSKNIAIENNSNELSNLMFLFKKESMAKKKIRLISEIERKWSKTIVQKLFDKIPNYFIKKSYSTKMRTAPDDILFSLARRETFSKKNLTKNKNKKNLTYWTTAQLVQKQKNFIVNKIKLKRISVFKEIPKRLLFLNRRGIMERIAYWRVYRRVKFMKEKIKNTKIKKIRRHRSRYFVRKDRKISEAIVDYSRRISIKYSPKLILKLEKTDIHHGYVTQRRWWRRWNANFERFLKKKMSADAKRYRQEYLAMHNWRRRRFKRKKKKNKGLFKKTNKHLESRKKKLIEILKKKPTKKKTTKSLYPNIANSNIEKGKWPSGLKYLP